MREGHGRESILVGGDMGWPLMGWRENIVCLFFDCNTHLKITLKKLRIHLKNTPPGIHSTVSYFIAKDLLEKQTLLNRFCNFKELMFSYRFQTR